MAESIFLSDDDFEGARGMSKLKVGDRVRYIGGQKRYKNSILYSLVGRTGLVICQSDLAGYDWLVEMDIGVFDIYAQELTLQKIEPHEADLENMAALENEL